MTREILKHELERQKSTLLNRNLSYQLDIRNSLTYRFKAIIFLLLAFSHAGERTGHRKGPPCELSGTIS